jgi:NTP pyrophosphatase (non-canonical NTP hydrolase)
LNRNELAIKFPIDVFDKVVEEAGEVLQAIGKYKRFGPDEYSPYDNDRITNRETLCVELDDLIFACMKLKETI